MMMLDISGMELHERVASEHPRLTQNFIIITGGVFTFFWRGGTQIKVDNLRA